LPGLSIVLGDLRLLRLRTFVLAALQLWGNAIIDQGKLRFLGGVMALDFWLLVSGLGLSESGSLCLPPKLVDLS